MPLAISYVSTGPWGAGTGIPFTTPVPVDTNFYNVAQAIEALENDRPQPNEIVSVTQTGLSFSFNLADASVLGPIDLPVLSFRFFEAWEPLTLYSELDTFIVDGNGIYTVLLAHTTGATFDAALLIGGDPAYKKLFGFAPDGGSSIVYDLEFQYQGVLSDALAPPVNFLALRPFIVPAASGQHLAYLVEAPATAEQVLPILHDATQIGTVTFAIGENDGTVAITADESIVFGDRLIIGLPLAPDAAASGLTVALAARRVV
jgi:hypothetical protein